MNTFLSNTLSRYTRPSGMSESQAVATINKVIDYPIKGIYGSVITVWTYKHDIFYTAEPYYHSSFRVKTFKSLPKAKKYLDTFKNKK